MMIRMDDEGFTTVHTKPKKRKGGKSTTALNTSYHVINSSSSLSTSSSSSHSHVSSSPRSPHSSKVTAPTITADTLKLLNISSTNEKVDISGIGVNGSAEVRRRVRCSGPFSATISECRGEQKNEISALESIFEADFYDLREDESTNMEDVGGSKNDDSMKNVVISFSLRLTIQAPPLGTTELLMHVTFPPFYPEDLPDILLESVSSGISLRMIQDLTDAALKKSEEYKGQPMVYDISEFIKEKLTEAVSASSAASAPGPESRSLLSSSSSSSQGPTSRSSTSTALAGDRPQAVIRFNSLSFEHDHGKEGKGDDDDEVVANAPEENKWIEEERRKKQMSVKMKKPSDAASFMVSDIFDEDGEEIDERGRDIFDVNASGNDTDEIGQELENEGNAASMKDMVQSLQVQTKGKKCNKSGKDRHKAHDKAAKENKREKEADKEEYKGARERKHRYDKDKLHQKREKEKKEKLDKRARDRHGAAEGKNVHEQGEGDSPRLTAAFEDKSMDPVEKRREEEDAEELAQWMGLSVFSAPLTVKPNSTGSANSKKQQGQTIALKPLGKEGYGKGGDVDEEEEEEEESEGGEKGDDDDDDEDDDNSNDDEFGDEDDEGDDQDDDVFGVVSKQQTVPRSRAIGEQTFKNESDPTSEFQQKEKEREELLRKQSRYLADFRQDGILGKGGFGEVYKVYKHFDDAYYAVKKIKMSTSRAFNKKIKGEIATIRLLNHPYIVRYYQSWEEDGLDVLGDEEEDEDDEDWMTTTTTLGAQDQHDDDNDDEDDDDDDNDTSDFEDDDGQFDDDDDEAYGNNATTATRGAKKAKEKVWKMDRKESLDVVHEIGGRKICKFLYIQMEYCANQTLRDLIDDMDFLKTPDNCWKLFQQILEAISYMHKRGVIHRDLKPANIFISDEANVKIGDFGLAVAQQTDENEGQAPGVGPDLERFSIYGRNRSGSNTVVVGSGGSMGVVTSALVPTKPKLGEKLREAVGTLMYAAPEQAAQDMEYDAKADMFAIGIIFFEMWRGPYSSESEKIIEISALRKAGRLPDNFRPYSSLASVEDVNKVAEIVRLLLAADPNDRPSAQDLLNSGKVPLKIEDERMEQVLQSLITSTSKGPFHARLLDTLFSTSATREEDLTYDHLAGRRNLRANDQAYNQVFKLSSLTVAKSMLHSLVIERLTRCFRSHGAVRIVTPLLMPKTGLTKSGKNTAYVLDQAGMLLQLPYTQTVPFARYVAQNYVREGLLTASKKQISVSSSSSSLSSSLSSTTTSTIYVDLKRFDFSPVYRQRYSFSPRMLGECNFDIVWAQPTARAIVGAATQDATSATVIATATPLTTITVSSSGSLSGQAEPGKTADVATALTLVTEREEKAKEKAALLTAEVVKAGRDALEAFSHVLGPVRIRVSHWWVFEAVLDVVMLSHCAHVLAERQALPGLSSSLSADMLGAEDNATEKDKGGLVQEAKVPRLPGPEGEKKLGHSTSIDSLSNYFFSSRSMDGFTSSVSADPLAEGFSFDGFPVTQAGSTLPRLTILSSKRLLQQVAFLRSQIRALAGTVRLTSAVQWTKSTVRRQLFSEKRLHPKALEVLGSLLVPLSSEAMDAATTEKEAERFLVSFESSVHQELESGMIDVLVKTLAVMKAHSSSPVTTTGSGTGGRVDVAASVGDASISAVNDDLNGASGGWRTRSAHFQAWKDLAPTVGGLEGLLHLPAAIDALRRLFRCLARMNVPAHMDLSLASPNEVYRAGTFFQIVSISNNAGGSGDHPGHLKPSLARRTSLTNATDAENVLAIGGRYDFLLNRFAAAESDASSVSLCGAGVNLAFDKIVNQLMLRHEAVGEAEMATMALGWPPHPSDHPHTRQRYHHQHQQRVGANSGVLQQKGTAKAHAQQHVHSSSSSSNSSSNSSGSGSGSNSNNSNNSSGSSGGSGSISTALIDVDSELPPSLALQTAGVLLFCLRGELLDVRLKVCAQLWFHNIHCDYLFPDSLKTPAEVRAFALERGMRYLVLFERASFKLKGDMKVKVTDLFVTISGVPKYKTDEEAAAGKKEKKSSKGGWHGHAVEAVVDTVVMPSASVCAYIMSKLQASGQHGSWCFAHRGFFGEEVEGAASGDRDADGGTRWSTGGGRSYSQLHGEGTNDEDGAGGGRGSVARKGDGYRDKVSASFLALDEQNVKIMWTKRPDARGDKNEKADKHRNSILTAKLRNLLSPLLRAYNTVSGCPYAVVACELTILMLKAVSSFFYSSQRSKGPLHNEAILKQIYGKDADQIPKAQKLMVCDLVNHVSNVLSQETFVKFVILFSITDEKTDILTV